MAGNVEKQYLEMDQMTAARADPEYALFCRRLHSSYTLFSLLVQ